MSFKKYIILMIVATVLSLISFVFIIFKINPEDTTSIGFALFYISLFLSISGCLSLLMIALRWIFVKNLAFFSNIIKSFRQAILFSVTIISFLLLKSIDLLKWWNMILIIGVVVGIEFFFVSHRVRR
jgi:hypothetical protein